MKVLKIVIQHWHHATHSCGYHRLLADWCFIGSTPRVCATAGWIVANWSSEEATLKNNWICMAKSWDRIDFQTALLQLTEHGRNLWKMEEIHCIRMKVFWRREKTGGTWEDNHKKSVKTKVREWDLYRDFVCTSACQRRELPRREIKISEGRWDLLYLCG